MTRKFIYLLTIAVLMIASSCKAPQASQTAIGSSATHATAATVNRGGENRYLPKAVIYKTNGDYNNNVAINLNANCTAVASYPAPSDVSAASAPVALSNGWLMDRRGGIGDNTAFLNITYSEYAKLKQAPSPSELMRMIIPGARVTEVKDTDVNMNDAMRNPSILNQYAK